MKIGDLQIKLILRQRKEEHGIIRRIQHRRRRRRIRHHQRRRMQHHRLSEEHKSRNDSRTLTRLHAAVTPGNPMEEKWVSQDLCGNWLWHLATRPLSLRSGHMVMKTLASACSLKFAGRKGGRQTKCAHAHIICPPF